MFPGLLDKKATDAIEASVTEAFDLLARIAEAQERTASALERIADKVEAH